MRSDQALSAVGSGRIESTTRRKVGFLAAGPGPARPRPPRSGRPTCGGPAVSASSTGQPSSAVRRGDDVAGRAGGRVDDGPVVAGQGVQEPALAHVRPSGQHDPPAARSGEGRPRPGAGRPGLRSAPSGPSARSSDDRSRDLGLERPWPVRRRISAVADRRGPGQVDARLGRDRRLASCGPRRPAAVRSAPAATRASTTSATAAGPPWQWTSTSGGVADDDTATTSSPIPAPIRPSRSRPGGVSASGLAAATGGTPRRRPRPRGPQTRTTATAPAPRG